MTEEVVGEPPELALPDVDAQSVRPGDTLIIRVDTDTALDTVRQIRQQVTEHVTECLPGVHVVVIAADQALVYRPDPVEQGGESGG